MAEAAKDYGNQVEHLAGEHHFVVTLGEEKALLEYRLLGGEMVLLHTEVPPAWEGRGIGTSLAHAALEYAREGNLTVAPMCPFVQAYLREHPEYLPLVSEEYREKLASSGEV